LDARPLPLWYDEAKFGIFCHWGVYSVPAYDGEWFWERWTQGFQGQKNFMETHYRPNFTYQDFAPEVSNRKENFKVV
jgi:alpha-L-fucosidase